MGTTVEMTEGRLDLRRMKRLRARASLGDIAKEIRKQGVPCTTSTLAKWERGERATLATFKVKAWDIALAKAAAAAA